MSSGLSHFLCGIVAVGMVVAAGQPIVADDAWLHLALGSLYSEYGPMLVSEPFLHTATTAPAPHGWLADIVLDKAARWGGFTGLRVLHAAFVCWILALIWRAAVRVSRDPVAASLMVAAMIVLSAYRLVQLRPQLFSIWAVLVLYSFFLRESSRRDLWMPGAVAFLCAAWANIHAGFVLGPILIGAALAGVLCDAYISQGQDRDRAWLRVRHLVVLGLAATLGSFVNPEGPSQFLLYFSAGEGTAELARVGDEWAAFPFWGWPGGNVPPTPFAWGLAMLVFLLTVPIICLEAVRRIQRSGARGVEAKEVSSSSRIDPALVALAGVSLVAMAGAVRFLWLAVFPLLLILAATRLRGEARGLGNRTKKWTAAACAGLLLSGFYWAGPWAIVGQFSGAGWRSYARAYQPQRYFGHAIWFMRDAKVEGRAFNPYYLGNFLGYWTTPAIRVFVNGSLAMSDEVVEDSRQITAHRSTRSGESLTDALDRYGVDLFLGVGLPDTPRVRRPWHYSTSHLEGDAAWIQIYRNVYSAVYLRRNERNLENLSRVVAYYRRNGVPFDTGRGFEPERVIRGAPDWALAQGVVPSGFRRLVAISRDDAPRRQRRARALLTSTFLALGLYDRALEFDGKQANIDTDLRALRRRVWGLLRINQWEEAAALARRLEAVAKETDRLSLGIVDTALAAGDYPDEEIEARIARLPLLEPGEAAALIARIAIPEVRPVRHDITLGPEAYDPGLDSARAESTPLRSE
jgi:hypothetical protein